jgi:hypothetical protein
VIGSGTVPVQGTCDVDAIAAATLACPAVAGGRVGGAPGVATYLPGRRVVGVRVEDHRVLVSVVLASSSSVLSLEAQVRAALAPHVGNRQVDVHVADVQTTEDLHEEGGADASAE